MAINHDEPSKFVYRFSDLSNSNSGFQTVPPPLTFNKHCNNALRRYKDIITEFNAKNVWDRYKKYANDYELIYTSSSGLPSISSYVSLSRSFYKLWEIMFDFRDEFLGLSDPAKKMRAVFLAEGPGGFVEAFSHFRKALFKTLHADMDDMFGMTLLSSNKNVPNWKLQQDFVKEYNIQLVYGSDGTGDLYNVDNIAYLVDKVGLNKCDFITGDGGFDFSTDFNEQEDASLRLIASEIYAALLLQAPGGSFILKIFDIFNHTTIKLLFILRTCYDKVYIVKPLSSRPANSEKYIVCVNFKGAPTQFLTCLEHYAHSQSPECLCDIHPDHCFQQDICHFNAYYTCKQVTSIIKTIFFIDLFEVDQRSFVENLKHQLERAVRWCHKYKVKINKKALLYYKYEYLV